MLTTFLLVSLRKLNRFAPSRVRLARVGIQSLETELDCEAQSLAIEFVEKSGYQHRASDRTLDREISVRLVDSCNPSVYRPFITGAIGLLKDLKRFGRYAHDSTDSIPKTNQENKISQIVDESLAKFQRFVPSILVETGKLDSIRSLKEEYFDRESGAPGRRFRQLCKSTVSQLQFWMIKGLDEIDFTKTETPECIVMKDLLGTLLFYLKLIIDVVVKPILESPDLAQYVHIAQRCHRVYLFLEDTARTEFYKSALSKLRSTLMVDWTDMISILTDTNKRLIDKYYKEAGEELRVRASETLKTNYYQLVYAQAQLEYQATSASSWRWDWDEEDFDHEDFQLSFPPDQLQYIEHRPHFDMEKYSSKIVLVANSKITKPIKDSLTRVTVRFKKEELSFISFYFSNNFMAIVRSCESNLWFTTTDAILELLDDSSNQPGHQTEVDSTALFESFQFPDPIRLPHPHENTNVYWWLLQEGIVQIYLAGSTWTEGYFEYTRTYKNDSHSVMQYVDFSSSGHERRVSRFDITARQFSEDRLPIKNHKFADRTLITRGTNEFLLSLLEIDEDIKNLTNPTNLHLAHFAVKDKELVSLNYSIFQFTTAQLARLDKQWRCHFRRSGSLQWIVKQNRYFSFSYLQSTKFCMWVHVFHRNRFLPIGPRQRPVPGLIQLGKSMDFILIGTGFEDSQTAFSEKLFMLKRKKIVYNCFALTPRW